MNKIWSYDSFTFETPMGCYVYYKNHFENEVYYDL